MKYFRIGFQLACGWYIANIILTFINLYVLAYAKVALGLQ